MAKQTIDRELFDRLRARGLRKNVARMVAEAAPTRNGKAPKAVQRTVKDLRSLLEDLEDRAKGGPARRSAAAQKAARTRKRAATKRSAAAKKAAKTRARA